MKACETKAHQRGASPALFLVLFALLSSPPSVAAYAEKVDQLSPQGYVNDFAGVLDADSRQKLTALAQEVDQKAGAQIAVVTIRTLGGDSVQDFTNRLFKKWGVWPKGKDRSVMILLAVDERQYWTEVGYGLEPILPDGKVGGFGRDVVPLLRQNHWPALRIASRSNGDATMKRYKTTRRTSGFSRTMFLQDGLASNLTQRTSLLRRRRARCQRCNFRAHRISELSRFGINTHF